MKFDITTNQLFTGQYVCTCSLEECDLILSTLFEYKKNDADDCIDKLKASINELIFRYQLKINKEK